MWRIVLVLAMTRLAWADPAAEATARGEELYKAGKYAEAAVAFEQAYAADPDPATLFNIAQSYRFANACAKAADYYRRYLAGSSSAPNADQVRGYISEQDACARRQAPVARRPVVTPAPVPAQPHPTGMTRRRELGIALVGAGVVGAAIGGYFTWRVGDLGDQRAATACTQDAPCSGDRLVTIDQRANRAELGEALAYGLGAAAVAGGVTLYVLGGRGKEMPPIALVPDRRGAFAVGTVRF